MKKILLICCILITTITYGQVYNLASWRATNTFTAIYPRDAETIASNVLNAKENYSGLSTFNDFRNMWTYSNVPSFNISTNPYLQYTLNLTESTDLDRLVLGNVYQYRGCKFQLRSSLDNYTTSFDGERTIGFDPSNVCASFNLNSLNNINGNVIFRIYFYGTENSFTNYLFTQNGFATSILDNTPASYNDSTYRSSQVSVFFTANCISPNSPTVVSTQNFTSGATVSNLIATGINLKWYTASTGGAPLASNTLLINNTTYWVSQSVGSCESNRVSVAVSIASTPAPTNSYVFNIQSSMDADVVVESAPVTTSTTADFDGGGSYLMASTLVSNGSSPTTFLPNGNTFTSAQTPTVQYTLAPYNGNNSIRISNTNFALIDTGGNKSAKKLYLLASTGGASSTINVQVRFTDETSENINGLVVNDWFGGSNFALKGFGRTNVTATIENLTENPRLYEIEIPISVANQGKNIAELYVGKTTSSGILNIMGLSYEKGIQTFCSGATLANVEISGAAIKWYAAATGGSALPASTVLVNNTTYYASQTVSGLESTTRTAIVVNVNPTPEIISVVNGTGCFNQSITVSANVTPGSDIYWYYDAQQTLSISGSGASRSFDELPVGINTIYVKASSNGCSSALTPVTITVIASPSAPNAASTQNVAAGATVAQLLPSGSNIKWYTTEFGGVALAETTSLISANYYVAQTANGCESQRTSVDVVVSAAVTPANVLSFDGNNDRVKITSSGNGVLGDNSNNESFTIEMKVKLNSNISNSLFSKHGYFTTNRGFAIQTGTTGKLEFVQVFLVFGESTFTNVSTATALIEGVWHHIAATYNASTKTMKLYLNGELVGETTVDSSAIARFYGFDAGIGYSYGYNGGKLNGLVDDVRVWNVERTQGEIVSYANSDLPASLLPTALVAQYKMNQGNSGANNSSITTLTNEVATGPTGTLENFSLNGNSSNWINETNTNVTLGTIEEMGKNVKFKIYPNPSTGIFNISISEIATMEVTNILSKQIKSQKATIGNSVLDLSDVANGLYIVKITTANGNSKTVKVVKQ